MIYRSCSSDKPTVESPWLSRWLRAGKNRLFAMLAVVGVGAALLYTGGIPALAQKAKKDYAVEKSQNVTKQQIPLALQGQADHRALAGAIDELVEKKLKNYELKISPRSTDEEFIRRVYLDIVGVIPKAEDVKRFLNDTNPNKRSQLIDDLLEDPRYGSFFSELWCKDMLPVVSNNRRLRDDPMQQWLTEKLNANTPWDEVVYDIVTARGAQKDNGAVTFFIANPAMEKVTDQVSKLFMGVQLECAQCHDHPFTDYKQDEYWGMAAFFSRVSISGNPNQAAKNGTSIVVDEVKYIAPKKGKKGRVKKRGRVFRVPAGGKKVEATFLKEGFAEYDKTQDMRPVLGKWMTSKDNPYFARAAANKLWYHFIGRGLVNPYNDMHDDNPATHPVLLATMADQLKQNDFDLKYMIRAICNSETYQRSSRPAGNNADDNELFSHALIRGMHPEQLYDSISQALGTNKAAANKGRDKKKARRPNVTVRDRFIDFFTSDDGYKPLEFQQGIPQALMLMNSKQIGNTNTAVAEAMKQAKTPAGVIEQLYLSTLSRRPTADEVQRLTQYVSKQGNPRVAYSDILWALFNSSEFGLNH